ncbi:MAG: hypothetical protein Kow0037_26450 [Calditrichia bacterium]
MKFLALLGILASLFFLVSCASHIKPETKSEQILISSQEEPTLTPLEEARAYLPLALQAEEMGDSLGAEYYFGKAMDLVNLQRDSLLAAGDSTQLQLVEEISLEYAKYLARLNGVEHDTLTAANVMDVINRLSDSTTVSDNREVKIKDVISGEGELSIPLVLNQKVENAIKYFQSRRGRRIFTKWLQRSGWYRQMAERILREEGVPTELYYLAMIESGFITHARSYANAVGMWQFIYSTGRAYGLKRSWWYDERQDPEKSTRAAARHLKDLYKRFGNWYLAIAGYNFSPGKIEKRINRYKVDEFWELPRLPKQTRNYVPTFIAAATIAKNPEKYGFYVEPDPPIEWDTVTVKEAVDLNVVAECVGSDFKTIKKLNPALLRFCTPPDVDEWVLNIPKGTRERFLEEYRKIPDNQKMTWVHHRIRSGETLSTIARRYGVSMHEIQRFNKIRGSLIRAGHSLIIPVPQNKNYAAQMERAPKPGSTPSRKVVANVPGREKIVHTVQKGETLWEIASNYNVTLDQIRKWNGLGRYNRIIKPGQSLNIWLPKEKETSVVAASENPQKVTATPAEDGKLTYIVKAGDTLWDIAQLHNVSISQLKKWNKKRSNRIKPGDRLVIYRN